MSVKISEGKALMRSLEKRFGKENMIPLLDKALKAGAEVLVRQLKKEFESFKDTGASIEEITVSEPMTIAGNRTVKIHWRGPDGRFRIIHLNEWGTVNNPNPKGKGAIARALRNAEKDYIKAISDVIKRGI